MAVISPRNCEENIQRAARFILPSDNSELSNLEVVIDVTPTTYCLQRRNRIHQTLQCSVYTLLSQYLDLQACPTRSFFEGLASYTSHEEEHEKLLELSSPQGTDLYYDYVLREKRSYLDVLEDFRSVKCPVHVLLELIPVMQPRSYSIASSSVLLPNQVSQYVAMSTVLIVSSVA